MYLYHLWPERPSEQGRIALTFVGLVALIIFCSVASSVAWAQDSTHVPCSDVLVTLDLPGLEYECSKFDITSADLAKMRDEESSSGNAALIAFIEAIPADATTYNVAHRRPDKSGEAEQWGSVLLSVSHAQHGIRPGALRDLITAFSQDWLFGSKTQLEWLSSGNHHDYKTQRYTEFVSNSSLPIGGVRSCFAFLQYRDSVSEGIYGQRLFGYSCRKGEVTIRDNEITEFLVAITVR